MADVFLSYAREDQQAAQALAAELERRGFSVWWDRRIPPGRTFSKVIGKALAASKCVVVLWSKTSVESDWVLEEADDGRQRRCLVPVVLDEGAGIPLGFRRLQSVKLGAYQRRWTDAALEDLAAAVSKWVAPGDPERDAMSVTAKRRATPLRAPVVLGTVVGLAVLAWLAVANGCFTGTSGPPDGLLVADLVPAGAGGDEPAIEPPPNPPARDSTASSLTSTDNPSDREPTTSDHSVNPPPLDSPPADPPPSPLKPVWITLEGGTFEMGSDQGERYAKPVHSVTVPSFQISKTEVTVAQYQACVEAGNCSEPQEDSEIKSGKCNWVKADTNDHPVNCVSWDDAKNYVMWLGNGVRLPTEAEWEYAARSGGKKRKYPWGDEEADCERAVVEGCAIGTRPVCSKSAGNTDQGLCDVAGNVWEWVEDDWHGSYDGAPADGSAWIEQPRASSRVFRGGSWQFTPRSARVTNRFKDEPSSRYVVLGFRVARSYPGGEVDRGPGQGAQDLSYVVKRRSTLHGIILRCYDTPRRDLVTSLGDLLADYNNLDNPDDIVVGSVLWLPAQLGDSRRYDSCQGREL